MATWVIGDVHGCAEELAQLVEKLQLGPDDRLVSCGDLFHRGPDPFGVAQILRDLDAPFVLGNHEMAILRRVGLAPKSLDDRPSFRDTFPELDADDFRGDGGTPCRTEPHQRVEMLRFLQGHSGFLLRDTDIAGAGPTEDGRPWAVVHAGKLPGVPLDQNPIEALTSLRRLQAPGRPWWYEHHHGPELVLFGHTHSSLPRVQRTPEGPVALGLDTGCVYGGKLTAYSPELDEFTTVKAARPYARERARS